ncbi:MAG: glutathione S-transferase family protein [Thiohalocapsa sp.]
MGLFGKRKQQPTALQLRGYPGDPGTNKCLLIAAERGVQLETLLVDLGERACDSPEYRALSPFGKVPCLRDGDFVTSGAPAVLAYLDIKGKGNTLNPKKASILAEQNFWVDLTQRLADPAVTELIANVTPGAPRVSPTQLEAGRAGLTQALSQLNSAMADNRPFIVGQYSFADIHWTACLHLCVLAGEQAVVEPFPAVATWFERVKSRKGANGQPTYASLSSLDEVQNKRLKSVA